MTGVSKHPVIVLTGEEDYFIRQSLNVIKSWAEDIDISEYEDLSREAEIVLACLSVPFGKQRVIIVSGDLFAADRPELADYVKSPVDSTILVFYTQKVDKRKSLYKILEKNAKFYYYDKLSGSEFLEFINTFLRDRGAAYDKELPSYIVEKTGYLLSDNARIGEVVSDLSRLSDFAGGDVITKEMTDRIITSAVDTNIFKIISLIASRRFDNAMSFMKDLLLNGVDELQLIALIQRHYRILYKLKIAKDRSMLELTPYMLKEFKDIELLSEEQIEKAINLLNSSYAASKGYSMEPGMAAELALVDLILV